DCGLLSAPAAGRGLSGRYVCKSKSAETCRLNQPLRLPRLHVPKLFGKLRGIGRRSERLLAEDRRCLMLPVPIARRAAESENDHVWSVAPHDPNHIGKDAAVSPVLHRFFGGAREAEVDGAREELLRAIDLPGVQQLLRADDAHLRALLTADQILPALAARERKIRSAHVPPAREVREHSCALIIGM